MNIGWITELSIFKMANMLQDIRRHIELADEAVAWAKSCGNESFPYEKLKDYRRRLKKIGAALEEKSSAAAYGESQVGKSYLMSSLLSSPQSPFVIMHGGKEYSFIDDLNPSGGNNAKIESTGVVTRFTLSASADAMEGFVRVRNLSVVDIILLLANSYYNDIKIDQDKALRFDQINQYLSEMSGLWAEGEVAQREITEDDIRDISDYMKDVIGNAAAMVNQSNFCRTVSPIIRFVPYDKWVDVFSLLWNRNAEISHMFGVLISEYRKIGFQTDVYIPFDAVLREKGTILKVQWLDTVCGAQVDTGRDELFTDVYSPAGDVIARGFGKGCLSALIAEVTFVLPEQIAADRPFLRKMDLLDFPGARGNEEYAEADIHAVLPTLLRRGKVAYLFKKYSRALRIGSVLFCFHNDQKAAPIGGAINSWVEENIGSTPQERADALRSTCGVAPLFLVATKFNLDLERAKTDKPSNKENLTEHWKRFKDVLPEIIKPSRWLYDWNCDNGGRSSAFQNIYPLRDFFWSAKNGVFDGYVEGKSGEASVHSFADYPDYIDSLKDSFLSNDFVKKHFANPSQTWDDVATPNNDGSKAIIRSLNVLAGVLDTVRLTRCAAKLTEIKEDMLRILRPYFEPDAQEDRNRKVKQIVSDVTTSLMFKVGSHPETFGKIVDALMVPVGALRDIAYDVIVCHSEMPVPFDEIGFLRKLADIGESDPVEVCVGKLCKTLSCNDEADLKAKLQERGYSIDMVVQGGREVPTTVADVVVKRIVAYWNEYMNSQVKLLTPLLPHADEIVHRLTLIFRKLDLRKVLSDRVERYCSILDKKEQPNAVADCASLILNGFVSNVGREYLTDHEIAEVKVKAENCDIHIDSDIMACEQERKAMPLEETLAVFDKAATDINEVPMESLMQLPFWGNLLRWENLLTIGMLFSSDISNVDPVANAKMKAIIEGCKSLYRS